ncbi:hypothetical protein GGF46_002587 [Coemansia sp. RSA 552]|nr:hypothetical protein GGF46_002587 [Coemansia sp. RSA 552]
MDQYIDSIQSQTIPLSVIDTQGSFSNIPFVFFYQNKDEASDFMVPGLLRDSFFRTMQFFPIFAGRVKSTGIGNVSVVIDADNLNLPDYVEDACDTVDFDEVKQAGYEWNAWPQGVATAGPMTCANDQGEIKLINVHIIRLKSNSGVMVYLSIPHYVLDGEGHMEVMRRWCRVYQFMARGEPHLVDELPTYTFDRALLRESLPDERAPVDTVTHKTFTEWSFLSEWFAWISPENRGYILSKIIGWQRAEAHLFHVSTESFATLRQALSDHTSEAESMSMNELLLGLASKTLAQAQMAADDQIPDDHATDRTLPVAVIFEVRKQLDLARKNYLGNVLMPKIVMQSLSDLELPTTGESLARTIATFGQAVGSLGAPLVGTHVEMVESQPSCFTRPITRFARSKTAMSFVYDIMPDMYTADFGHGKPEWVSPIQPFRANAVLLLTHKDANDGVDVFMTAFPPVMKEILRNSFWTSVAKVIY